MQEGMTAGARRRLRVTGAAGDIECALSGPREAPLQGALLVCHPHPLYGGTMDNKVVTTLAAAGNDVGLAALRFNFRGVGASAGAHDEGCGEADDCERLATWLRAELDGLPLLLAGFSFGGFVALRAQSAIEPAGLVTVAPAARYLETGEPTAWPRCPWLSIHAADDDVVPLAETQQCLAGAQPPPRWEIPDSGGHFFHGRLDAVRAPARDFMQALLTAAAPEN